VLYFFGALGDQYCVAAGCLWAASFKIECGRAKWLMHATVLYIPLAAGAYDVRQGVALIFSSGV